MNCLQLTDYLPEYPGNFGTTLIAITKNQSRNNDKCVISFPEYREWHSEIKKAGGKLLYIPVYKFKERKIDIKSINYLNKIIKQENIDLLHVHFGLYQKILSIVLKLCNPKLKIVWHWRGDVQDNTSLLKRIQIFIFYRLSSQIFVKIHIANSKHIYNRILKKHFVSRGNLFSVSNAIDINSFDKTRYEKTVKELAHNYDIRKNFTLIMIRNFRKRVDFEIILDTMELLKNESQDIQLLWIGHGERESEIKQIAKLKDLTNIKFLGKVDDPVPYYYISKINIIAWEPWCNETINNTVYEALACELPVIGLNMGSLSIEFDESEGVYTVPLDPLAYAEKILNIRANYHHLKQNILKGKEKVSRKHSLDSYVSKLQELYNF